MSGSEPNPVGEYLDDLLVRITACPLLTKQDFDVIDAALVVTAGVVGGVPAAELRPALRRYRLAMLVATEEPAS